MSLKALSLALAVAFGAVLAPGVIAKEDDASPQIQASPEMKRLAESLIEDALRESRISEIYADLRLTLRDVYLPLLRDTIQGDLPGAPPVDSKTAAIMAKAFTFLDYARRAGDELEGALNENRQAMISDAATVVAKAAIPQEINDLRALLHLPAIRKGFDTFYALTRLVTGFSYQDTRSLSEFSAWAQKLNLDFSQALSSMPEDQPAPPTHEKIAQAQVLFNDLLRISHFDEMVVEVQRFVRDVYAETAPMSDEERKDLKDRINQFEFTYNLQRLVVFAAAPSLIAAALTDEQFTVLKTFVHSTACAQTFDLFHNFIKTATAFTKEDILAAQGAFQDFDHQSQSREKSIEESDRIHDDWKEFSDKWIKILKNRLSPETLSGLEGSWETLEASKNPI